MYTTYQSPQKTEKPQPWYKGRGLHTAETVAQSHQELYFYVCVYVCAHECVGQMSTPGFSTLSFETGSVTKPHNHQLARQNAQ